jgi:hypothetical protein
MLFKKHSKTGVESWKKKATRRTKLIKALEKKYDACREAGTLGKKKRKNINNTMIIWTFLKNHKWIRKMSLKSGFYKNLEVKTLKSRDSLKKLRPIYELGS